MKTGGLYVKTMTDILDDSYESDLTEEEHERLILMSEHAIAKPLSPAAQAVLAAYRSTHLSINNLAAALRAVAQQAEDLYCADLVVDDSDGAVFVLRQLMLIADELEAL
jgi:hypothetical protein